MKKISAVIGFAIVLFACSKKHSVAPENSNSVVINGTTYPTVTIGNQVWTTVNYRGPGGYHSADHNQYGDYYNQTQAQAISLPGGWRIPTMIDYSSLLGNFTVTKHSYGYFILDDPAPLLSKTGWLIPATNQSGFNAQPGGAFLISNGTTTFLTGGEFAYFMTSDFDSQNQVFGFYINDEVGAKVGAVGPVGLDKDYFSLRFVKNK